MQPSVLARCVKPAPWHEARRCLVPARRVDFETLVSRRVTVWPGYWCVKKKTQEIIFFVSF